MFKRDLFSICTFYAISPIHAGSGASMAAVDLPIQRERHTNWPHIQASAVKGAMRAHYRDFAGDQKELINFIFGYDKDDGDCHSQYANKQKWTDDQKIVKDNYPGAVSFSEAKLLAFPVRSNIAPFVWVTCPAVLKRLKADLEFTGIESIEDIPTVEKESAIVLKGEIKDKVVLEDAVVTVIVPEQSLNFRPEKFPEMERHLLISDEMYKYCVDSCTEIQTQIKIDSETGTAAVGSLRYQELLPADSVLYSVVYYSRAAFENVLKADMIRQHVEDDVIKGFMQIGGDETLGRGICRINWVRGGVK
jgi:CRISPR-associated protein Cmr4